MILRKAQPADAPAIARVHVDSWRTTYHGVVPEDLLIQLSYEQREQMWMDILNATYDSEVVYVVEDDAGQVVGFASGGPERSDDPIYKGELYATYLLHTHQRQGLGRRLAVAVMQSLAQMGLRSMLVWVFANNPARYFYEALGGQQIRSQAITTGGTSLDEIAYGWLDTTLVTGRD